MDLTARVLNKRSPESDKRLNFYSLRRVANWLDVNISTLIVDSKKGSLTVVETFGMLATTRDALEIYLNRPSDEEAARIYDKSNPQPSKEDMFNIINKEKITYKNKRWGIIQYEPDNLISLGTIADVLSIEKLSASLIFKMNPELSVDGEYIMTQKDFLQWIYNRKTNRKFTEEMKLKLFAKFGLKGSSSDEIASQIGIKEKYEPATVEELKDRIEIKGLYDLLTAARLLDIHPAYISYLEKNGLIKTVREKSDKKKMITGEEIVRYAKRPKGKEYTVKEALKAVPGMTEDYINRQIKSSKGRNTLTKEGKLEGWFVRRLYANMTK